MSMHLHVNRPITADDLWSAWRGLSLGKKSKEELHQLVEFHRDKPEFASQVIAEAARQALAIRRG